MRVRFFLLFFMCETPVTYTCADSSTSIHTHMYKTNSPSLASLTPKLLALLRSGVGLNTRCCAANVVVVLGTRFRPEVNHTPHSCI